jgi:hypothetical protein
MGINGIICSSCTNGCFASVSAEEQLRAGRQIDAGGLRQHGRVFADEILVGVRVRATAALAFLDGERRLGELFQLREFNFTAPFSDIFCISLSATFRARTLVSRRCTADCCRTPRRK